MENNTKARSALPYYVTAAAVIIYAFLLPLYKPMHYLIATVVCGIIFLVTDSIMSKKAVTWQMNTAEQMEKQAAKMKSTGNPEADTLLKDGKQMLANIIRAGDSTGNETVKLKTTEIVAVCMKIFDYVQANPTSASKLKQFMNFYLPTVEKLLTSYQKLEATDSTGENVTKTMNSIEGTLDTIRGAFEKQLDSLFEDTAVDITADISVLKNQLAQNGLAEYQMTGNNLSEVPATAQAIDEIQQVLSQGK